MTISLDYLLE